MKDDLKLTSVPKAIEQVTGLRPPPSTWRRWIRTGLSGGNGIRIKLKATKLGGRIYTTPEDVAAFIEATSSGREDRHAPLVENSSNPRSAADSFLQTELAPTRKPGRNCN